MNRGLQPQLIQITPEVILWALASLSLATLAHVSTHHQGLFSSSPRTIQPFCIQILSPQSYEIKKKKKLVLILTDKFHGNWVFTYQLMSAQISQYIKERSFLLCFNLLMQLWNTFSVDYQFPLYIFFSFSILVFPKDIYIDINFLSWSHLVPNTQ